MKLGLVHRLTKAAQIHGLHDREVDASLLREARSRIMSYLDEMRELEEAIHYPKCWDTVAYPTLLDALKEVGCNPDCCCQK